MADRVRTLLARAFRPKARSHDPATTAQGGLKGQERGVGVQVVCGYAVEPRQRQITVSPVQRGGTNPFVSLPFAGWQ